MVSHRLSTLFAPSNMCMNMEKNRNSGTIWVFVLDVCPVWFRSHLNCYNLEMWNHIYGDWPHALSSPNPLVDRWCVTVGDQEPPAVTTGYRLDATKINVGAKIIDVDINTKTNKSMVNILSCWNLCAKLCCDISFCSNNVYISYSSAYTIEALDPTFDALFDGKIV